MIESPEQFAKWRDLHDLTQGQAAERLGVSKRSVATYESTGPIPKTVALACEAITNEAQNREILEKLVKEQHPKLKENVLVLPLVLQRASTFKELVEISFTSEVDDWVRENTPSAKLLTKTVITPEMMRRELALIAFEDDKEAFYFKLRWF